jgi:hypothetical protein
VFSHKPFRRLDLDADLCSLLRAHKARRIALDCCKELKKAVRLPTLGYQPPAAPILPLASSAHCTQHKRGSPATSR